MIENFCHGPKPVKLDLPLATKRALVFFYFAILIPLSYIILASIIYYTWGDLGTACAFIYLFFCPCLFLFAKSTTKNLRIFSYLQTLILLKFILMIPSHERDWNKEQEHIAQVHWLNDKQVQIDNFRNSKHDLDKASSEIVFSSATFDIEQVASTHLVISYWDSLSNFAHTFLEFRFNDGRNICISVEARFEKTENFDPFKGLYKQYELNYVIGSSSDLIKLRLLRQEECYRYACQFSKLESQKLLKAILIRAEKLQSQPEFYNSLYNNCTTNLIDHFAEVLQKEIPLSRRVLLNGLSDQLAYDSGLLKQEKNFFELKSRSLVQAKDFKP